MRGADLKLAGGVALDDLVDRPVDRVVQALHSEVLPLALGCQHPALRRGGNTLLNFGGGGVIVEQEQTLFKRSAAEFDKVLIVWQSFTAARKQKSMKNILKVIFEVEGVVTQKNL